MPDDAILKIIPTLPFQTSCALNWSGVEVHRYRRTAGESKEHFYPQLAVFLHHTEVPYNCELTIGGTKVRVRMGNQSVSIVPPWLPHSTKRDGPGELTAIFLDSALTTEIALAITGTNNPEIVPQFGIRDPLIREIGTILDAEMALSQPHPGIYAESLAAALGSHIYAKYASPVFPGSDSGGLKRINLRRSIEFMKENLAKDLALAEIAVAAGMSKYHFAKSFRVAMGVAPHRYLVSLRIEKARKLLAVEGLSVEEIAGSVGYADTAHFAEQFRKFLGVSPSYYRRSR